METERGVATTYKGNYTQAQQEKRLATAQQWQAYEKWQKEVDKQKDIVRRCAVSSIKVMLWCFWHWVVSFAPQATKPPSPSSHQAPQALLANGGVCAAECPNRPAADCSCRIGVVLCCNLQ